MIYDIIVAVWDWLLPVTILAFFAYFWKPLEPYRIFSLAVLLIISTIWSYILIQNFNAGHFSFSSGDDIEGFILNAGFFFAVVWFFGKEVIHKMKS